MITPTEAPQERPQERPWFRRRAVLIAGGVVAGLAVLGIALALLWPDGDRGRDRVQPAGFDRPGSSQEHRGPGGGPFRDGDFGGRGWGDTPVVAGTVVSTGDGTLVVAVDGAAQRTFRTDDSTRGLGELQVGERVVVAVEDGDPAVAREVWTPQARVTGTVTAVSGDRATVTAVDGLVVTVDVSGLAQKPVVGDVASLTGVAADAATIRAESIRILPKAS